jgi:aminoglycoside phosphotransferase (APT) family kinase protein
MVAEATEAGPPGIEVPAVTAWIEEHLDGVCAPLALTAIGDGKSNLTYRVDDARGGALVLRRPPVGPLLASAHDMRREHKVISGVGAVGFPIPAALALCEDEAVTGAPFYVMEHVEGRVLARRDDAEGLDEATRRAAGVSLVETLARLHAIDVEEAGLATLARPEPYAARQIRRWRRQWEDSKTREVPAVEEVAARLEASMPEQRELRIVHGDYRLGNTIVADDGAVRAVLDWELCTLGDPLADVGLLMVYWGEAGEAGGIIEEPATVLEGFPSRDEVAEIYARTSGRDLADLPFWHVLSQWKLTVIAQGIWARFRGGQAYQGVDESFEAVIDRLAEAALERARDAGLEA